MSLELPGVAVVAFNMVGLPWPGLDEDVLRAWAKDLRAFSAQVADSSGRSRGHVAAMAGEDPSPPAKRLLARWDHYHGVVSDLRGPMEGFAGALDVAADAVVAQKGVVIGAAVALAAEVVATQGEALVTFGLAEAEVPAEVAVARMVVKGALQFLEGELLAKLVSAGCSELSGHLGKAVSSLVSGGGQVAVEAWSLKAAYDQGTLQKLGSTLTKNQSDAEAAGSGSQRLASGRQLATDGPGGGWREVAAAVEQAVLRVLTQLFRDLVHALRTVVDDTLAATKSMVSQLERMDAERPAAGGEVTAAARLTGDGEPGAAAAGHDAGGMPPTLGTGGLGTGGEDEVPGAPRDTNGWAPGKRDLEYLGLKPEQMQWLAERKALMGMTPGQYQEFHASMLDAARADGIDPAGLDIRAQGSAAHFYSSNKKSFDLQEIDQNPTASQRLRDWVGDNRENLPAHHVFESRYKLGLSSEKSDYDLNVSSSEMVDRAEAEWKAKAGTPYAYKDSLIQGHGYVNKKVAQEVFPNLQDWSDDWSSRLGRDVSWAVFPSTGPLNTLDTNGVSVHFRDSDWIIHAPEGS